MPSVFSHAVAGAALGTAFRRPSPPARFWLAGAACAAAPDLDVLGRGLGIPWGHMLGHRGITHSFAFAAVLAAIVAWTGVAGPGRRAILWLFLFVATASHGVLDAMTDGGSGVALLAPFDSTRYFLPWRPIPVSPMGFRFFSAYGLEVFEHELVLIWLPAAMLVGLGWAARAQRKGER
jgi:inner membrane protein